MAGTAALFCKGIVEWLVAWTWFWFSRGDAGKMWLIPKPGLYHPGLGRFLQRDPIGFRDDFNMYRYVGNNPTTFVDPWGLCEQNSGGGFSWADWWLKESTLPGPFGQPMSEWNDSKPTSWGDPIKYTDHAGGGWKGAEDLALGIATVATTLAGGAGTGIITNWSVRWKGGELGLTRPGAKTPDWRFNPTGGRGNNPYANRPHYHRRPGIDNHRPWEGGW